MTDRVLLENQIAIMSALLELAHAVGYGTKVRTEMIATLRARLQESEATLAPLPRADTTGSDEKRCPDRLMGIYGNLPTAAPGDGKYEGGIRDAARWERTRKSGGLD